MRVKENVVIFEDNEKEIWANILERDLSGDIPPDVLRGLGEARVKELSEERNHITARMAARLLQDIPPAFLH